MLLYYISSTSASTNRPIGTTRRCAGRRDDCTTELERGRVEDDGAWWRGQGSLERVRVCVHCVGWRGRVAEYDLSLFLGDRYLCIDMGDGGVALGWCWLRLVANSNAEACCIFTPFFWRWCEVGCIVRGKARIGGCCYCCWVGRVCW